jgi:glyoxylase-like metal-dependent hydrolase (beta-lactamase superfamily II)/ferredoxin
VASARLRRIENAPGDFFVDETCIDCDQCRQIAPSVFVQAGDRSAVRRQPETDAEEIAALKALVTCPTASIGAPGHSARRAVDAFPERIDGHVFFCGYASRDSFGASSYLIARPEGNVLVDSPRFARSLVARVRELGGVKVMFLTHRDDVADHEKWAAEFRCERVLHEDDAGAWASGIERKLSGVEPIPLADDLLAIPTPGHTRGHMVLLHANTYLFTGDHVWWSERFNSLNASQSVCWYSWPEQTRSMERLRDYGFEWVLPGHGRRARASAEAMRGHLDECIDRMGGARVRRGGMG